MNEKLLPARTLERKKREAEALKANMKKRKDQAKLLEKSDPRQEAPARVKNEIPE